MTTVRKLTQYVPLTREEFRDRFAERFYDPAFDAGARRSKTSPPSPGRATTSTGRALAPARPGQGFEDPDFELPVEWLETRRRRDRREAPEGDPAVALADPHRLRGVPKRSDVPGGDVEDVPARLPGAPRGGEGARLRGRRPRPEPPGLGVRPVIHPCKACVSTAMPLCHWPCSCYPNHAMGQVNDWMAEIYERWVAAHGVMIVTPGVLVRRPGGLKVMIDRLVCADGGNPDPTSTRGKDPARAKELELAGRDYPKHLAGRGFAVVVHGDVEGWMPSGGLTDWLSWMHLIPAGRSGSVGRYVGYCEAPHHCAEMLHLVLERILPHQARDADFERLPPRLVLGAGIGLQAHRRNREAAHRAGDDVAILVVVRRIARVLLRRVLPASLARRGVRQHERAERAVGEADEDRHRVLDREVAGGVRRECLHGDDLAAQRAQVVDLVDHVEQDGAAAGFAPPRAIA